MTTPLTCREVIWQGTPVEVVVLTTPGGLVVVSACTLDDKPLGEWEIHQLEQWLRETADGPRKGGSSGSE